MGDQTGAANLTTFPVRICVRPFASPIAGVLRLAQMALDAGRAPFAVQRIGIVDHDVDDHVGPLRIARSLLGMSAQTRSRRIEPGPPVGHNRFPTRSRQRPLKIGAGCGKHACRCGLAAWTGSPAAGVHPAMSCRALEVTQDLCLEVTAMPHHVVADALDAVSIQPGAIVSKVIYRDKALNVTVFGFDAGEGLTEHQAGATAIVQVLTGRLRFTADGEELDAGPGFWLHMAPGTPHALVASEPTVMLLTLVGAGG